MTAQEICWLLRKKYEPPEYAICFEVGDCTGLDVKRHLDAVVMNLYPSRGLSLTGFEIKVSRGDLKREVETPQKAEAIARYLDAFYIVCPADLNILDIEVPLNWGIIYASEDGLKTKRAAQPIVPIPLDRKFLGALLRGFGTEDAYRIDQTLEERRKVMADSFEERMRYAVENEMKRYRARVESMEQVIKKLEQLGISWSSIQWHEERFVNAVKRAMSWRELPDDQIRRVAQTLETCALSLRKELDGDQPVLR